jgi:hypothetical protein
MSERKIISDFKLTTPYTFNKWFRLPIEDIFSELQFIAEKVSFGKASPGNILWLKFKIRVSKLKIKIKTETVLSTLPIRGAAGPAVALFGP